MKTVIKMKSLSFDVKSQAIRTGTWVCSKIYLCPPNVCHALLQKDLKILKALSRLQTISVRRTKMFTVHDTLPTSNQNIRLCSPRLILWSPRIRGVEFYFNLVNYVSVISARALTSSLHYYQSRWQGRRCRAVRTRWPLFHRTLVGPWISNQSLMKSVVTTGIYGHWTDPKVSASRHRVPRAGTKSWTCMESLRARG